ncbi:glyoxylate reductase [Xanthoria parietina]
MSMSESKPRVLLLGDIDHAPARSAYDSLSSLAHLITPQSTNPADFLQECQSGAFNGTKAIYRTFGSVSITGRIEGEIVKTLAEAGVRFIAHNGAGYDQIDIPTCTSHKIHVSNTAPPALAAATADTALFLLLAALRNFNPAILSLRAGAWRGGPTTLAPLGHDPYGKTLGILGMGGIGRNLAGKAAALGMNVTYHNRRQLPPADEGGARYVDFETLLEGSDVLSLNVPLNEKTKGMIGKEEFAKMKRGAVVVNTARGGGCG